MFAFAGRESAAGAADVLPKRSCLECSKDKKKCERPAPGERCVRCIAGNHPCTEQDYTLSRRKREMLERSSQRGDGAAAKSRHRSRQDVLRVPGASGTPRAQGDSPEATHSVSTSVSTASHSTQPDLRTLFAGFDRPRVIRVRTSTTPALPKPPRSPLAPTAGEPSIGDILYPALSSFFAGHNRKVSILHRGAFESAFVRNGGPIYGEQRPAALAFAAAAWGLIDAAGSEAVIPDELARLSAARNLCAAALELLRAGYLDREPEGGRMTDLEALQSMLLLWNVSVPLGQAAKAAWLARPCLDLLRRMAVGTDGEFVGSRRPSDAAGWLRDEMVLRAWIVLASIEQSHAYALRREPIAEFFGPHRLPLPSHEVFFLHPNHEEAFRLLLSIRGSSGAWAAPVDFTPFARNPTPEAAALVVRDLVEPVFSCRASFLAFYHVGSLCRSLRIRMRPLAAAKGQNPATITSRPESDLSPAERAYAGLVAAFAAAQSTFFSSMPREIGANLAEGIPEPLLGRWRDFFADHAHAAAAVSVAATLHAMQMEQHFHAVVPRGTGQVLISWPALVQLMESAVLLSRTLAGLQAADPDCALAHIILANPALRLGSLGLAAARLVRRSGADPAAAAGFEHDARVTARVLGWLGRRHGPCARKIAANFRVAMASCGLVPDGAGAVHQEPGVRVRLGMGVGGTIEPDDPAAAIAAAVLVPEEDMKRYLEVDEAGE